MNKQVIEIICMVGLMTLAVGCNTSKPSNEVLNSKEEPQVFYLADNRKQVTTWNEDMLTIERKIENPVLKRGEDGKWDSVDVLNPSVIEFEGNLFNYYSGYDGRIWRTGIATSEDGLNWSKYEANPVIDIDVNGWDNQYIAANGAAIVINDKVYYYYQGQGEDGHAQIGLAISEDGYTFEKYSNAPVLSIGDEGTWDERGVADPYVIEFEGKYYLYYLGMNNEYVQKLGVAISEDGINWVKNIKNPIMDVGSIEDFDTNGLGEPSIFYEAPYFYMIYTGRDKNEIRDIGIAISTDGINFKKINNIGIFNGKATNSGRWNSRVICDTTIIKIDGQYYMYYGGGDSAEPAQNLNGEIGLALLRVKEVWDNTKIDINELLVSEIKLSEIMSGVYDIESDSKAWIRKESSVNLEKTSDQIVIKGYVPNYQEEGIDELAIDIYINGNKKTSKVVPKNNMFMIEVDLSDISESGTYKLEIKTDYSFKPSELGGSNDTRDLSFILYYIGESNE